jgi:hypothetical protein
VSGEEIFVAAHAVARLHQRARFMRVDRVDEAEWWTVREECDEIVGSVGHASGGYRRVTTPRRPASPNG